MNSEELIAIFDKQAPSYDKQQEKMAPIINGLYFLLESVFADLPTKARVLCVGAGTGAELVRLASKFPQWRFTVVEPSKPMLNVCRQRAKEGKFSSRCYFHEGYLTSLPIGDEHDAATCFLVSQFIIEQEARSTFFRAIANRLRLGGILASSDLASGVQPKEYESLLTAWMRMMAGADIPPEGLEKMRVIYSRDVAILPSVTIASIIESGGFETPVQFFQAGLLHAWFSQCRKRSSAQQDGG